jgi:hypothetical protein
MKTTTVLLTGDHTIFKACPPRGPMMQALKTNPRAEYRQLQCERINSSATLRQKFPELKSLTAEVESFDSISLTRNGGMKYKANIQKANSVICFPCPSGDCTGGDFDLSKELSRAVSARRTIVTGEKCCAGVRRHRQTQATGPCENLMRYKLRLTYLI